MPWDIRNDFLKNNIYNVIAKNRVLMERLFEFLKSAGHRKKEERI